MSLLTKREHNANNYLNQNDEEFNSSAAISSYQHEGKMSDTTDSKVLNKDYEDEKLQSNNTTLCNNVNEATIEKRFTKDSKELKKYVIKNNKGKFMLSKKMLNLNKEDNLNESDTKKPNKKLKTKKDIKFNKPSIEGNKEEITAESSYVSTRVKDKKFNKSTYKINDNNYYTEYSKDYKNTFKIGSHHNSLEGNFKFEKDKRNSDNK